jgi:hypothetical protein
VEGGVDLKKKKSRFGHASSVAEVATTELGLWTDVAAVCSF